MQNSGVLVADNGLTISADTIFNSRGAMSGQDVKLAATDSVLNAGGSVQGGTVSVTAVNDVISASDTVTFTSPTVTATHIGKQGSITADGDLTVVAGKNIGVFGSDVAAEDDLRLAAGNSVIVSTQALGTHAATSGKGFNTRTDETVNHAASVTAGGALNIDAGGSVTVHGSQMASGDAMTVKAGGDVAVTAASDTVDYHGHSSSKGGGFFGGKKSSTSVRQDSISVASQLESGGDMTIEAGTSGDGAATIAGSQLTSGGDMSVTAADDVLVTSVTDQRYTQDEEQKKGTFTSKMALDETRKIDVVRSELDAKGDVVVASRTGDVTVKASQLRADGAVALKAEQGGVALLTDKELAYERHVSSDTGWLTWSSRDKGTSAETVLHTLIESGENISITAKDGVVVEFHHTGDARADVRQLAKTPGLEWMAGLPERDDVDWRAVQAVYDTWDRKDGGLGPAAMLVIAIAVSAVTYGAASQLSAAIMGLSSTSGLTGVTLAMHTALTAGFVSLSSQVATGLANAAAGGDFKETLNSIVSEDGARSLLASMVLAGTLDTMTSTIKDYGMAGQILTVAAVKASVGTVVGGQAVETALLDGLSMAFSRYAAGRISAAQLDKTIEIVLSGAAGAATAAIAGQDPMMGAMSSIVAALANAIAAPPLTAEQKKQGALFSELSECSYKNNCTGTEEFKQLTAEQVDDIQSRGIDISSLENNKSGLKAFIFYNANENQLAVVIRGTQLTDLGDLSTDTAELFGLVGGQHTDAALAIQGLKDYAHSQGMALIATGHSLGGGISSALAAVGLVDGAITFNSAGVNDSTISKIIKSEKYEDITSARSHADSITKAYISRGDMINNFQDILKLFIPTTLGERILVDGGGLHGIEAFRAAFGK